VAAALCASSPAGRAGAHEPFQVTTDVRALRDGLTLHVAMASRTATLACPEVVRPARSLSVDELGVHRAALEACAKGLYVVTGAAGRLEPRVVVLALTDEGDLDARIRYDPAPPGPLELEAVHLARLPDAMFGAELTVTSERSFLGQALLRAGSPVFKTRIPDEGEVPGEVARRRASGAIPWRWVAFVVGLALLGRVAARWWSRAKGGA
jgi:hypothetical protein